jgi:alpha-beta hydrolase superfamily lysophospholipase
MAEQQNSAFKELGLVQSVSKDGVSAYHRHLEASGHEKPVLVLVHGYPQSAYEYG